MARFTFESGYSDKTKSMIDKEFTPFYLGEFKGIMKGIFDDTRHGITISTSRNVTTVEVNTVGITNVAVAIQDLLKKHSFFGKVELLSDIYGWTRKMGEWYDSAWKIYENAEIALKSSSGSPEAAYDIGKRFSKFLESILSSRVKWGATDPSELRRVVDEESARIESLKKDFYKYVETYKSERDSIVSIFKEIGVDYPLEVIKGFEGDIAHTKTRILELEQKIKDENEKKRAISSELESARATYKEQKGRLEPVLKEQSEIARRIDRLESAEGMRMVEMARNVGLTRAMENLESLKNALQEHVADVEETRKKYFDDLKRKGIKMTKFLEANAPSTNTVTRVKLERAVKEAQAIVDEAKIPPSGRREIGELRSVLESSRDKTKLISEGLERKEKELKRLEAASSSNISAIDREIENHASSVNSQKEWLRRYEEIKRAYDKMNENDKKKIAEYIDIPDYYIERRTDIYKFKDASIPKLTFSNNEINKLAMIVASLVWYTYTRDETQACEI